MTLARVTAAGLVNLTQRYLLLRASETAGCDIARLVV
jgi:hypothetical protein